MKLQDFMCFLQENKLVDINSLLKKDEIGCINRLKLQKYVYLAQTCLNNNIGYEFSIYSNGPYSPELANYYYETMDTNSINASIISKNWKLDTSFTKGFLDLFKDKELEWLVIASILIDSKNYFEDEQEILNKVYAIKSEYSKTYIGDVWNELKNRNLVQYKSGLKLNNFLAVF
ncbi:MAG TPA: hypothetical protein VFG45_11135 [Candidatus Nitrosocosmicus sp.]|nr:hypothetical protein [Candidatus Nitrosocosmicus sp.]